MDEAPAMEFSFAENEDGLAAAVVSSTSLTVSGSFKEGRSSSRRRPSRRPSFDSNDFMNLLHGSDPVKVELNQLENEVRDKDREISDARAEIADQTLCIVEPV